MKVVAVAQEIARIDSVRPLGTRETLRLTPEGMQIGTENVPLLAGSVHYFRLNPKHWGRALAATRRLGVRMVDTYVPWNVHEVAPSVYDFGERRPELNLLRFIELAKEEGLYVILRPGPHINAELTHFGIPERIIWDPSCQARSPKNNPVVLPMLPQAFPVPSYASQTFLDETCRYFTAFGKWVREALYPHGPVVMVQVDNEGAMYFRDGVYDQDYHPDAIAAYRSFIREKYRDSARFRRHYGELTRIGELEPPTRFDAEKSADLPRHLDWAEFQERLLADAMTRFAGALRESGIGGVPLSHNFPPGQEATPLNAARMKEAIDLVGYDYYGPASEAAHRTLLRRTTELAVRSEALRVPAFGCEVGAGFPPFFPPLSEADSEFTVMTALAYGLKGFNIYMAVERDRWIGAPIDAEGRERPFAEFWRKLTEVLTESQFFSLRRHAPVRLLVPRSERRLARVTHAFGPISGAFFSVAGAGARESALEEDFGQGSPPAVWTDTFLRLVESTLASRGVPFAQIAGEDRDLSLDGAKWIITVTSGSLNLQLAERLRGASKRGSALTFGPHAPTWGPDYQPVDFAFEAAEEIALVSALDPAEVEAVVSAAIERLELPTYSADVEGIVATVHHDREGRPRMVFVINPTDKDHTARVTIAKGLREARDLFTHEAFEFSGTSVELPIGAKTVRMLSLSQPG